jgi:hypothetical protein
MSVKIYADHENNGETFWPVFDKQFVDAAKAIRSDGFAIVTMEQWEEIQSIDGFSDGAEFAKDALLAEFWPDGYEVSWEFMGRASAEALIAASAVSVAMEIARSTELTSSIIEAAVGLLGGDWDAESVESMLTHCSFEVA